MEVLRLAAWVVAAYLLGSVPFGLIIGRVAFGVDIREHGSRNLGATNAARVLGAGRKGRTLLFFAVVFVLDSGKGFLPAYMAGSPDLPDAIAPSFLYGIPPGLLAGAGAVAGHMASVYLKFRGGKGVAVSTGALAALVPLPLAVAAVVWGGVVAASRFISLGSVLAALSLPVAAYFFHSEIALIVALSLLAVVVVVKHRTNLARIMAGVENRVGGAPPKHERAEGAADVSGPG